MVYDFAGKVALVTGASRGIGYEVALELARRGVQVIAVARSQSGLEALDDAVAAIGGKKIVLAVVDLSDAGAVRDLVVSVRGRFGGLDILVGNAGVLGGLTPVSQLKGAVMERVFSVNFLANQLLIAGFEDYLRASGDGRAIFVTSGIVGVGARGFWGCYGASKAALENLVLSWSDEVVGVCVNLFNPGGVWTDMYMEAYPGADKDELNKANDVAKKLVDCITKEESGKIFNYARL